MKKIAAWQQRKEESMGQTGDSQLSPSPWVFLIPREGADLFLKRMGCLSASEIWDCRREFNYQEKRPEVQPREVRLVLLWNRPYVAEERDPLFTTAEIALMEKEFPPALFGIVLDWWENPQSNHDLDVQVCRAYFAHQLGDDNRTNEAVYTLFKRSLWRRRAEGIGGIGGRGFCLDVYS